MGLNTNHTFEELGDIKCSVIEKNCNPIRVEFLKKLLEINKYSVVIVKSPPPKAVSKPVDSTQENVLDNTVVPNETFIIGVTDLSFNMFNAIYNRELLTVDGIIVTPNYWKQTNAILNEDSWYWKK